MNKGHWLAFSILIFFISETSGQNKVILSAGEFQEQIRQTGIQILDVRTSEEYSSGHITNAFLADWRNEQQFKERVEHLDKSRPLYVYCGSGGRSNEAAKWLRKKGFKQVYELQNGILGWKKNNNPLEVDIPTNQLTKLEFDSLVTTAPVVLIDFGAKWCPPCKKMEPVIQQLQRELKGKFVLHNIDGGTQTDIMRQLSVQELPTFIIYSGGKEVWRKTGLQSVEGLKKNLEKHF